MDGSGEVPLGWKTKVVAWWMTVVGAIALLLNLAYIMLYLAPAASYLGILSDSFLMIFLMGIFVGFVFSFIYLLLGLSILITKKIGRKLAVAFLMVINLVGWGFILYYINFKFIYDPIGLYYPASALHFILGYGMPLLLAFLALCAVPLFLLLWDMNYLRVSMISLTLLLLLTASSSAIAVLYMNEAANDASDFSKRVSAKTDSLLKEALEEQSTQKCDQMVVYYDTEFDKLSKRTQSILTHTYSARYYLDRRSLIREVTSCISAVAQLKQDAEICEKIKSDFVLMYSCIIRVAEEKTDVEPCEQILNESLINSEGYSESHYTNCITNVAVKINDISLCKKIEEHSLSEYYNDRCISIVKKETPRTY